jgi:hypothetical protein
MILDMMGWKKIVIERSGKTVKFSDETIADLTANKGKDVNRYIYFTGGEDDIVRKAAINVFNMNRKDLPGEITKVLDTAGYTGVMPTEDMTIDSSYIDNKQGKLCRLFCITSAGAEGLSLQNVRAVHIMEPHWNDVRMAQVKGRAIRICSHKALKPQDRNVKVYTYITVFDDITQLATAKRKITDEAMKERMEREKEDWSLPFEFTSAESEQISVSQAKHLGLTVSADMTDDMSYYITTDVALLALGSLKKETSDRIQKIMKQGAVDCDINFNENKDGTFACINFKGGDFLYHPDLATDVATWSKQHFADKDVPQAIKAEKVITTTIKGVKYTLKPIYDSSGSGKIDHFDVYIGEDKTTKKGTWNADESGTQPKKSKDALHLTTK